MEIIIISTITPTLVPLVNTGQITIATHVARYQITPIFQLEIAATGHAVPDTTNQGILASVITTITIITILVL